MKQTKRKYNIGDKVKTSLTEEQNLTINDYQWNGYSWMYSFIETDLRCGEEYLKSSSEVTENNSLVEVK